MAGIDLLAGGVGDLHRGLNGLAVVGLVLDRDGTRDVGGLDGQRAGHHLDVGFVVDGAVLAQLRVCDSDGILVLTSVERAVVELGIERGGRALRDNVLGIVVAGKAARLIRVSGLGFAEDNARVLDGDGRSCGLGDGEVLRRLGGAVVGRLGCGERDRVASGVNGAFGKGLALGASKGERAGALDRLVVNAEHLCCDLGGIAVVDLGCSFEFEGGRGLIDAERSLGGATVVAAGVLNRQDNLVCSGVRGRLSQRRCRITRKRNVAKRALRVKLLARVGLGDGKAHLGGIAVVGLGHGLDAQIKLEGLNGERAGLHGDVGLVVVAAGGRHARLHNGEGVLVGTKAKLRIGLAIGLGGVELDYRVGRQDAFASVLALEAIDCKGVGGLCRTDRADDAVDADRGRGGLGDGEVAAGLAGAVVGPGGHAHDDRVAAGVDGRPVERLGLAVAVAVIGEAVGAVELLPGGRVGERAGDLGGRPVIGLARGVHGGLGRHRRDGERARDYGDGVLIVGARVLVELRVLDGDGGRVDAGIETLVALVARDAPVELCLGALGEDVLVLIGRNQAGDGIGVGGLGVAPGDGDVICGDGRCRGLGDGEFAAGLARAVVGPGGHVHDDRVAAGIDGRPVELCELTVLLAVIGEAVGAVELLPGDRVCDRAGYLGGRPVIGLVLGGHGGRGRHGRDGERARLDGDAVLVVATCILVELRVLDGDGGRVDAGIETLVALVARDAPVELCLGALGEDVLVLIGRNQAGDGIGVGGLGVAPGDGDVICGDGRCRGLGDGEFAAGLARAVVGPGGHVHDDRVAAGIDGRPVELCELTVLLAVIGEAVGAVELLPGGRVCDRAGDLGGRPVIGLVLGGHGGRGRHRGNGERARFDEDAVLIVGAVAACVLNELRVLDGDGGHVDAGIEVLVALVARDAPVELGLGALGEDVLALVGRNQAGDGVGVFGLAAAPGAGGVVHADGGRRGLFDQEARGDLAT